MIHDKQLPAKVFVCLVVGAMFALGDPAKMVSAQQQLPAPPPVVASTKVAMVTVENLTKFPAQVYVVETAKQETPIGRKAS